MALKRTVKVFKTSAAMAAFAAALLRGALGKKKGRFVAALPGGSTPLPLFDRLAGLKLPWGRVLLTMSDERLVSWDSPESNFGAARARLFSKVPIPRANLLPVKPGKGAAANYSARLLRAAGGTGSPDMVILGLGADGHTASIFPGSPALLEETEPALAVTAPPGLRTRRRVTLTLRTINSSPLVVLLASGPAKKRMFERAAAGDKKIPAGLLAPGGRLYLLYSENE
jgi:6-phosphogluconolactonase